MKRHESIVDNTVSNATWHDVSVLFRKKRRVVVRRGGVRVGDSVVFSGYPQVMVRQKVNENARPRPLTLHSAPLPLSRTARPLSLFCLPLQTPNRPSVTMSCSSPSSPVFFPAPSEAVDTLTPSRTARDATVFEDISDVTSVSVSLCGIVVLCSRDRGSIAMFNCHGRFLGNFGMPGKGEACVNQPLDACIVQNDAAKNTIFVVSKIGYAKEFSVGGMFTRVLQDEDNAGNVTAICSYGDKTFIAREQTLVYSKSGVPQWGFILQDECYDISSIVYDERNQVLMTADSDGFMRTMSLVSSNVLSMVKLEEPRHVIGQGRSGEADLERLRYSNTLKVLLALWLPRDVADKRSFLVSYTRCPVFGTWILARDPVAIGQDRDQIQDFDVTPSGDIVFCTWEGLVYNLQYLGFTRDYQEEEDDVKVCSQTETQAPRPKKRPPPPASLHSNKKASPFHQRTP